MAQKKINISILQMSSTLGDVEENIRKVVQIISKDLPETCDVLVLPEVWTVGWACRLFQQSAETLEKGSAVYDFLSSTAKNNNVNIIGGSYITKQDGQYYNTCPVFDREGNLAAFYNKNHLYSYYGCDEDKYVAAGKELKMVTLDGIHYGLSICYDIRFPEVYRSYAKSGADVLVNCAAWGSKKAVPWEVMTKSRAVENQCYMLALTQSGYIDNGEYNLGQSRIIDYNGNEVSAIMLGEGIASGVIDIDEMYDFREKSPIIKDVKDKYEVKVLCEK